MRIVHAKLRTGEDEKRRADRGKVGWTSNRWGKEDTSGERLDCKGRWLAVGAGSRSEVNEARFEGREGVGRRLRRSRGLDVY